jgi:hypothetical protein
MLYGISGLCPQRLISTVEKTSILPSLTGEGEGLIFNLTERSIPLDIAVAAIFLQFR